MFDSVAVSFSVKLKQADKLTAFRFSDSFQRLFFLHQQRGDDIFAEQPPLIGQSDAFVLSVLRQFFEFDYAVLQKCLDCKID